jgi:hypothetical protein
MYLLITAMFPIEGLTCVALRVMILKLDVIHHPKSDEFDKALENGTFEDAIINYLSYGDFLTFEQIPDTEYEVIITKSVSADNILEVALIDKNKYFVEQIEIKEGHHVYLWRRIRVPVKSSRKRC